jgi:hypothetical protein
MSFINIRFCRLAVFLAVACAGVISTSFRTTDAVGSERFWFLSAHGGQISNQRLTSVAYDPKFANSKIAALAVGREMLRRNDTLSVEAEAQFVRHAGQEKFPDKDPSSGNPGWGWAPGQSYEKSRQLGWQEHMEYNAVLVLRFLKLPWDRFLDTSFALGEGISYSTKIPPIEVNQHAINHGLGHNESKLLNYLMVEAAFRIPATKRWHFFYRIHHRSGVYGLIRGVSDASNFVGLGIRYEFR